MDCDIHSRIENLTLNSQLNLNSISKGKLEESLSDIIIEQSREDLISGTGYNFENFKEKFKSLAYAIRVGEINFEEFPMYFQTDDTSSKFVSKNYDPNYLSNLSDEIMKNKHLYHFISNDLEEDALEDLSWELENS